MSDPDGIDKAKLASSLSDIRKDIAWLHKDIGGAAGNETRWFFVLIWLGVANLVNEFFPVAISLGISAGLVLAFYFVESRRIRRRAYRSLAEGVHGLFDTGVDLS